MEPLPPRRSRTVAPWLIGAAVLLVPVLVAASFTMAAMRRRSCAGWYRAVEVSIREQFPASVRRGASEQIIEELRASLRQLPAIEGADGVRVDNPGCG